MRKSGRTLDMCEGRSTGFPAGVNVKCERKRRVQCVKKPQPGGDKAALEGGLRSLKRHLGDDGGGR